jgi:hypothetical protein
MPRPNKIWFRKDIGWWMVTLGGKRLRLAEGRENKKQAQQKFHELTAERPQKPEGTTARVADIIEAFLAWTKIHLSENTKPPRASGRSRSIQNPKHNRNFERFKSAGDVQHLAL